MIVPLRVEILAGLAALVIGGGALAWHEHSNRLVAEGIAREKTRVADSALKVITPARIIAETAVVHSVKTVTRLVSRLDTLRDTVLVHLRDTTVVKEFIAATDTFARKCSVLASECETSRLLAASEIQALNTKLKAAVGVPSKSCTVPALLSGLVGLGVGYVAHRP